MTETEWMNEFDVSSLIFHFQNSKATDRRRLRLFGCACCRQVWHLLMMKAVRLAVEAAEAFADGELSEAGLAAAGNESTFEDFESRRMRPTESGPQLSTLTYNLVLAAKWLTFAKFDSSDAARISGLTAGEQGDDFFYDPERDLLSSDVLPSEQKIAEQVRIFLDIFGNPFRSVSFDTTWRTHDTVGIARKMYDERNFDVMHILVDALEDAGCDNTEILKHCREPGLHVRGCWVVDLLLDKK